MFERNVCLHISHPRLLQGLGRTEAANHAPPMCLTGSKDSSFSDKTLCIKKLLKMPKSSSPPPPYWAEKMYEKKILCKICFKFVANSPHATSFEAHLEAQHDTNLGHYMAKFQDENASELGEALVNFIQCSREICKHFKPIFELLLMINTVMLVYLCLKT